MTDQVEHSGQFVSGFNEGYKAASEDYSDGERISSLEKALKCRTTERDYHMRVADKLAERIKQFEEECSPYSELIMLREMLLRATLKAMLALFDDKGNITASFDEMQKAINDGYNVLGYAKPDYEVAPALALEKASPDSKNVHAPELKPWRVELDELIGHLGTAVVQSTDREDQIIMDHIKAAHEIAKIVRRKA